MIKIDRSELDVAIQNLSMFEGTKKILKSYESEKSVLEKRQSELNERLDQLKQEHAETLISRETETNTKKYVQLSKKLTSIDEEVTIILSLVEQLQADFTSLKEKYVPIIRDSYSKDIAPVKSAIDVNALVETVKYQLLQSIADYVGEIQQQEQSVFPTIQDEFLSDSTLMRNNPSFKRRFDFDRLNLAYWQSDKAVIHKDDVRSACAGSMPRNIVKPKDVN